MIVAIDIETKGLDCTKFVSGCLIKDRSNTPEIFHNKKKLWERVLELGRKEAKRGKILSVYSHNATYDFYGYADLKDKNIEWFCHRPFIVSYKEKGVEIIKFLDTLSLFRMSLKKLGDMIGLKKLETPKELLSEETKITPKLLKEIEPYMIRDTEIVIESLKKLRKTLNNEGINVKRLMTINQIAINYLINQWRKIEDNDYIFWNKKKGEVRRVFRDKEIHSAYRGGRVECFKTGKIKNVTYIDCNSLYPYSAINIEFPDLRTERKVWKPKKDIIKKIGISRCLIKNVNDKLGLLPIRIVNLDNYSGNYYFKAGTYAIGTWSHNELREAIKSGYHIIDIEWSVVYKKAKNPFKDVFKKLYELRLKEESEFNSYFYKMMMNASLGKLAQRRTNQKIKVDSIESVEEYIKKKYKVLEGIDYDYVYQKTDVKINRKPYYTPIVPTLVNAYARVFMYKMLKKIPREHLIYTDTDSIMFTGDYMWKYYIGKNMGEFKVEFLKEEANIYGLKTYSIGNEIKISGFRKKDISKEDFEKGSITSKKMITLKTASNIKDVGKFKEEKRDLKEQLIETNRKQVLLSSEKLFIDDDINNINYFLGHLKGIV